MLAQARRLRWVHSSAVAVGTLPLEALAARGIAVTNSRGVQSAAIAEHVIACVLALAKQLPLLARAQQAREWVQNELVADRAPWLVQGRTMAVVGLGSIGAAVAVRGAALGMRVIGVRRRVEQGTPPGVERVAAPGDLAEVLALADVVVLAAPLTGGTERLLDAAAISRMKPGAVLVNVARGQLVDEAALADALASGHLAGAALDVFTDEPLPPASPFWSLPSVIVTPHTSGFRVDHWDAAIDLFEQQLDRFRQGLPLLNVVDTTAGY
jgi:phosphoglycerate dehydrogenase-like enzyme